MKAVREIRASKRTVSDYGGGAEDPKKKRSVCKFWLAGSCRRNHHCHFLHSRLRGRDISIVANLHSHTKAVTGIGYRPGGDKLYSGSRDGTLRIWDCNSGECAGMVDFGTQVSSMIVAGSWVFVGLPNLVKAFNIESCNEFSLNGGLSGQVYTVAFDLDRNILFAGTHSGQIMGWKISSEESGNNKSDPIGQPFSLEGHSRAVVCFTIGLNRLHSGSLDGTIKVFDLETRQCAMMLRGHSGPVMSLILWANCLISCSIDCTIKAWQQNPQGLFEVCYTHQEEEGVLALSGMNVGGPQGRDVLLASCNDNCVRLYELPSFKERGGVFTKEEARVVHVEQSLGGMFFVGDGNGLITVAKLAC